MEECESASDDGRYLVAVETDSKVLFPISNTVKMLHSSPRGGGV